MKGIYHYQGMRLHYLSEDGDYAVYWKAPKPGTKPQNYHNPYRVYSVTQTFGDYGWTTRHKLLAKYADLHSAVRHIRAAQGFSA